MTESLSQLSNVGLVEHGDRAVGEEHSNGLRILEILAELERRLLHLEQGYSSLFDYCTRRWRYSPSKAGRYIAAARAMVRHPELRRLLEDAQLTICGAARIATTLDTLDAGDSDELLRSVAGKTYAEIDGLVAKRRVAPRIPDRIRPIGVRAVAATAGGTSSTMGFLPGSMPGTVPGTAPCNLGTNSSEASPSATEVTICAPVDASADRSAAAPGEGADSLSHECNSQYGSREPASESLDEVRYDIRFSASREFVEKLERAKAVCSARGDLEAVLEAGLDQLLERRDPDRREARRARRMKDKDDGAKAVQETQVVKASQATKVAGQGSIASDDASSRSAAPGLDESSPTESQPASPSCDAATGPGRRGRSASRNRSGSRSARSRHIPARIRDTVFARDGGSCSYVGSSGVRCGSRRFLQIDHVHPFSLGGGHDLDNLRLLCGRHNRLEADRVLGEGVSCRTG